MKLKCKPSVDIIVTFTKSKSTFEAKVFFQLITVYLILKTLVLFLWQTLVVCAVVSVW